MELRSPSADDGAVLRRLARRSLESTFASVLPPDVVTAAVDEWYRDGAVEAYVNGDEMDFVIGSIDGEPVGFCQYHVIEEFGKGRILWVHVDPEHSGAGIGSDLLAGAIERLHGRSIETVTAVVLAEHEAGVAFYEANGFRKLADREVEIAGKPFREHIMREERSPDEPLELRVNEAGEEFYVDLAETDRGSLGPFCPVYRDPDRNHRYGWFCTACESLETAMDPMGRIRCSACDNTRRPTRWDAAYL